MLWTGFPANSIVYAEAVGAAAGDLFVALHCVTSYSVQPPPLAWLWTHTDPFPIQGHAVVYTCCSMCGQLHDLIDVVSSNKTVSLLSQLLPHPLLQSRHR